MKIEIEWTEDVSPDCDLCGSSSAEGANVKINGETFGDFTPIAACYDSDTFAKHVVLGAILTHLGETPVSEYDDELMIQQLQNLGHEVVESETFFDYSIYDYDED